MPDEMEKYFVNAFLQFLKTQVANHSLSSEATESLEVAIQCLEAAYEIDSNIENTGAASLPSSTESKLLAAAANIDLFELFQSACIDENPNKLQEAEDIKNEGNRLMKEGKFIEALHQYNKYVCKYRYLSCTNYR